MLVDGASVNSLCQQGGLFALSVKRHSVIFYIKTILNKQTKILNSLQFFFNCLQTKIKTFPQLAKPYTQGAKHRPRFAQLSTWSASHFLQNVTQVYAFDTEMYNHVISLQFQSKGF